MLPFTRDQFLAVFASYNLAVWEVEIVAYLLGLAAVAALLRPGRNSSRVIASVLALMWVWTGVAYHWLFFATINQAAYLFGLLFVVEGLYIGYSAVMRDQVRFCGEHGVAAWLGIALLAYAAVLYPLIGMAAHSYPELPMFGVTPCPVTLFTFGMFLLAQGRLPRWILVIPVLWSLIGGSAAVLLAIPQDWLLLLSGFVVTPLLLWPLSRGRGLKAS
jgi:Family of unknown function (DUF6064)